MKGAKVWKPLMLAFSILLFTPVTDACTGMYAGMGMTADGTTMTGRTQQKAHGDADRSRAGGEGLHDPQDEGEAVAV